MHPPCEAWLDRMKDRYPEAFAAKRVFEGGSMEFEGSVRPWFDSATEYVGCDWRAGPLVDHVGFIHEYREKPDRYFDTCICVATLEHDPYWRLSLNWMMWLLKRGGWMIISAASHGHPEHERDIAPGGYYGNVSIDFIASSWLTQSGVGQNFCAEYANESQEARLVVGGSV